MKPIAPSVEPTLLPGLELATRGKVCQLYVGLMPLDLQLKVISNRISVHDIILPFHVPGKGEVLNFIDHFWRRKLFTSERSDLVAIGAQIDRYLPLELRGNAMLHRCARVIEPCEPLKAEIIFRGRLTGTGLKKYRQNNGMICGQQFPPGLKEWDVLSPTAFTPTTKDDEGHDEHMTVQEFASRFGDGPVELTRTIFEKGMRFAQECGIVIADTKFEVGKIIGTDYLVVIDEVLTLDSSRFIDEKELMDAISENRKPASFDKQPVRDYLAKYLDIHADTPLTPEVIHKSHTHAYPEELILQTANRYEQLLQRLTGKNRDEYAAMLC